LVMRCNKSKRLWKTIVWWMNTIYGCAKAEFDYGSSRDLSGRGSNHRKA
jgi:hypothetical protein